MGVKDEALELTQYLVTGKVWGHIHSLFLASWEWAADYFKKKNVVVNFKLCHLYA